MIGREKKKESDYFILFLYKTKHNKQAKKVEPLFIFFCIYIFVFFTL